MLEPYMSQWDGVLAIVVHDREGCTVLKSVCATADTEHISRLLSQRNLSSFAVTIADRTAKLQPQFGDDIRLLSVFDRHQFLQWKCQLLVASVVATAATSTDHLLKLQQQLTPLLHFLQDNMSIH